MNKTGHVKQASPNPALQAWKERVSRHHAQSEAAQADMPPQDDFWKPLAPAFRADPRRTDDPLVERLARELQPGSTLLDVGGGAGRLALALALRCRRVTVVEPSESMMEELRIGAGKEGIRNVTVVASTWEAATVKPADAVLCSHVLYTVEDVDAFVRKLAAHAKKRVLLPMFMEGPQSHLPPFWERVHREQRAVLPALKELMAVLWEMGIYPDLEMLESVPPPHYDDRDNALRDLRFRLYVQPGTEKDRLLQRAMKELLVESEDGLAIMGAGSRRLGLASWSTD
ncbi:MAG: class I SAM-dependent methyltransferase [SAR202 cluster bacterium]|nr:class I SAM-dependent methyltransferase [SAR202 cluster bacterium]